MSWGLWELGSWGPASLLGGNKSAQLCPLGHLTTLSGYGGEGPGGQEGVGVSGGGGCRSLAFISTESVVRWSLASLLSPPWQEGIAGWQGDPGLCIPPLLSASRAGGGRWHGAALWHL